MKNDYELRVKILLENNLELLGKIEIGIATEFHGNILDKLLRKPFKFIGLNQVRIYQDNKLVNELSYLLVNKQSIMLIAEDQPLANNYSQESIPELPSYQQEEDLTTKLTYRNS